MARPPAGPPPVTTALARQAPQGMDKYAALVEEFNRPDRQADLVAMLKSQDEKERFLSVTFNAIATNSDLLRRATLPSIIQAVKNSATLGLEPTGLGGEAYILVFGDQATLIPGWRGYLKRIRNSGMVEDIDCQVVYENDEFEWRGGTEPSVRHVPNLDTKPTEGGPPTAARGSYKGAYAVAWMPSGRPLVEYMSVADIEHDAKSFSPSVRAGRNSPWDTHWGEMARKTVIRRLSKRLPQSAVLLQIEAVERQAEEAEKSTDGEATLNVTRARAAVLAQIGARKGLAAGTKPEAPKPEAAPEAAPEPVAAAVAADEADVDIPFDDGDNF